MISFHHLREIGLAKIRLCCHQARHETIGVHSKKEGRSIFLEILFVGLRLTLVTFSTIKWDMNLKTFPITNDRVLRP
jgi:hypothetical protein